MSEFTGTLSSSSTPSSSPSLPPSNFSHILSVKLTPENYLLWKVQLVPYLRGQGLYKFVDGSSLAPPPVLPTGESNPEYETWAQQDQFVMFALISSLSEPIIAQVIGCSSAREVWLSLASTYASSSQARILQTQFQLASLKKGTESISAYFQRAKLLANTMAAAGRPLPSSEFVLYLLAGLGPDYDALVSSVTTRLDPIPTESLLAHLLAHEARLQHHSANAAVFSPEANFTARGTSRGRGFRGRNINRGRGARNNYRGRGSSSPNGFTVEGCNGNQTFQAQSEVSDNPARVLTDISKTDPAKSPSRRERESTLRTSIEKSSVKTDIRTTRTVQRTPILEDSRNQKAKFVHDNKSGEKESMTMKAGESQPSSLKAETRRYQPLHRLSCTVNLTKADTSSSAAVFSFKSNEHAERRKEFYTELQQKMHAKEAEMNQMQVRRQEKTEAEIKQFRRSLNFKATPMPSFYHVAVPRSDGKKAPSSNSKVNKARDKSTNPGSRAAGRSKSCLKEGSDQASSTNESVNTTARIDALEKTNCPTGEHSEGSASSQTLPSNQSCFLGVGVENNVGRRKEREKERDTSMYKHRVSEIHKVMKGQRAEGKQKVGAREMARKDMKSSGIGSSSGLGNLVVGVAS